MLKFFKSLFQKLFPPAKLPSAPPQPLTRADRRRNLKALSKVANEHLKKERPGSPRRERRQFSRSIAKAWLFRGRDG
jgi:hypothetical protein